MQLNVVFQLKMQRLIFVGSGQTFFLIKEYLGRPFGMFNKPHSKELLNAARFYPRGRGWKEICGRILSMSRMCIYRCLTFKEMFQGAHSADMQNRRLLIQLLLKPSSPFFKISLRNVGNLGRGESTWEGEGKEREMERDVLCFGCKSLHETNQIPHPQIFYPTPLAAINTLLNDSHTTVLCETLIYSTMFYRQCELWVIWMCIAVVTTLRLNWGASFLHSLAFQYHCELTPTGGNQSSRACSFCVFIPQLEHHIVWKSAFGGDKYETRPLRFHTANQRAGFVFGGCGFLPE